MSITAAQLSHLLVEIGPRVEGGVVRKARCEDSTTFALEIRSQRENQLLLFSLHEHAERFHLAAQKRPQPDRPADFVHVLRKHIIGRRISSIRQLKKDRVVQITLDRADGNRNILMAELTGRHGNVFLLDHRKVILGNLLPNRSFRRKLQTGEPYIAPAPLSPGVRAAVWQDELELESLPADGSRSRRIETHFRRCIELADTVRSCQDALRRLRKELKSLRRRETAVESDLQRARDAQRYRKWGELLQSVYGKVARGSDSVEVEDYYEEGLPAVKIPLDPRLDLQENVARYFQRYKKFRDVVESIEERLQRTRKRIEGIEIALTEVETASREATGETATAGETTGSPDREDRERALLRIRDTLEDLERRRLLKPRRATRKAEPKQRAATALPYREFRSESGKVILVGKGGRHNDTLTFRHARGNDLWLHARDWAGAHVVVRLNRDEAPDPETLVDAATLAAHYSKAKNADRVDVSYTRAKYVRKPKGAAPGKVTLAEVKTMTVRMEKARIDRLLDRGE